jgi:tetratricopeptide (TPR) repeat protein
MTEGTNSNPQTDLAKLQGSPHDMASWRHAQQYLQHDRHTPALASYRRLVQQFPGVAQLWAELGGAAAGNLDFVLADQAFQRALELAPADAAFLDAISQQYYHLRRLDQAFACLKRAVAADPSSVPMRLRLAASLEQSRRLDEAWDCIETCLTQHPKDGRVLYFKAFLLHRKGLNGEAETALRDLMNDPSLPVILRSKANYLLGAVLDGFGQYAEALGCLGKAKTLRCQTVNTAALEQEYERVNRTRRELLAELTPETLRRWREEAAGASCPHPLALLGGAMRSGTTLIEQILGAHPDILAFDESMDSLKELLRPLHLPPPARGLTLKSLNGLTAASHSQLISRYLKSLLRETEEDPGGRLLLDKNPSTTAWLHVWLRIFPQSKVIIALRDPRDIIISCYFQNIPKDWAIVRFASLEQTVRFYSNCMDVWLRLRELGGFEWIETRYEDVVGNLDGEGRRVTNFLGLPWHEAQAAYYETARRKYVHSPTYNEVTKPVYNRAVGRWQHYAEALAPLQAGLAKYCQAFGYC